MPCPPPPFESPIKYFLFLFFFIFRRNVIGYSDDKLIHNTAIAAALSLFLAQLTSAHHEIMFVLVELFEDNNPSPHFENPAYATDSSTWNNRLSFR